MCNPFVPFMKILDGPMQHVCIHQSHWVPVECLGTLDEHSLVTRRTLCGIGNVHYRLCITQDVGCRLRTMNLLIPIYSHLASSAGKQIQNRFTFNYLLFTWQNIACLHVTWIWAKRKCGSIEPAINTHSEYDYKYTYCLGKQPTVIFLIVHAWVSVLTSQQYFSLAWHPRPVLFYMFCTISHSKLS